MQSPHDFHRRITPQAVAKNQTGSPLIATNHFPAQQKNLPLVSGMFCVQYAIFLLCILVISSIAVVNIEAIQSSDGLGLSKNSLRSRDFDLPIEHREAVVVEQSCDNLAADPDDIVRYPSGQTPGPKVLNAPLAVQVCQRALSAGVTDKPRIHDQLGRAYQELEDMKSACNEYKLAAKDGYAPGMARYGHCLLSQGQLAAGVSWLEKAIPGSTDAKFWMGDYYFNGYPEAGIPICDQPTCKMRGAMLIQQAAKENYKKALSHPAMKYRL